MCFHQFVSTHSDNRSIASIQNKTCMWRHLSSPEMCCVLLSQSSDHYTLITLCCLWIRLRDAAWSSLCLYDSRDAASFTLPWFPATSLFQMCVHLRGGYTKVQDKLKHSDSQKLLSSLSAGQVGSRRLLRSQFSHCLLPTSEHGSFSPLLSSGKSLWRHSEDVNAHFCSVCK